MGVGGIFDAANDGKIKRVLNVGDQQADDVAGTGAQPASSRVGVVTEALDRLQYAAAERTVDRGVIVEHARDRGPGHMRVRRDIFNRHIWHKMSQKAY